MSIFKHWISNTLVIGFGLLTVCTIASAQAVFDDTETDGTPPKAEWRQKVLHNNKVPQQMTRDTSQNSEYRTAQRWSPNRNSNQDTDNRTAQRTSYSNSNRVRPSDASSAEYGQSKNTRVAQRDIPAEMEEIPVSTQYEPLASEGSFAPQGDYNSCGGDGGECGECADCDCPWMAPCGGWGPRTLGIFGGVHGYKGPRDRGQNGNFGFQEGVNFGAPLGDPWGCGYQLGFGALQSNISGYQENYPDSTLPVYRTVTADRHQYFFTGGIFRRAECAGWQWGVVFDLLHDTYYQSSDLKQIRSETGYLFNENFEIGYSGAYGIGGDQIHTSTSYINTLIPGRLDQTINRNIDGQLDPTDQFMVYMRRYFCNGGDGRIWGGVTGNGDGLFGADAWIPLGGSWSLQNSFNYLIPKGGRGASVQQNAVDHLDGALVTESWSVAMNLVWYPGRSVNCLGKSCYRPLLNVADNSLFMVRETTQITNSSTMPNAD